MGTGREEKGGRTVCRAHGGGESVEARRGSVIRSSWPVRDLVLRPVISDALSDILLAAGPWSVSAEETLAACSILMLVV